jgi:hypothetical protein
MAATTSVTATAANRRRPPGTAGPPPGEGHRRREAREHVQSRRHGPAGEERLVQGDRVDPLAERPDEGVPAGVRSQRDQGQAGSEQAQGGQHDHRAEQTQQHRRRPGCPVYLAARVVADHPPDRARGLQQRRRHEQHADRDVPVDQARHVEQGDQLGDEAGEQDQPGHRRQPRVAGRSAAAGDHGVGAVPAAGRLGEHVGGQLQQGHGLLLVVGIAASVRSGRDRAVRVDRHRARRDPARSAERVVGTRPTARSAWAESHRGTLGSVSPLRDSG